MLYTNTVMMDAFADELNKLAYAQAEAEEIEKLAEIEVVAQQLCYEYNIDRDTAYELMKEAGMLTTALKGVKSLAGKARGLTRGGKMKDVMKAPIVKKPLSPAIAKNFTGSAARSSTAGRALRARHTPSTSGGRVLFG
jgi:hypothetical protein